MSVLVWNWPDFFVVDLLEEKDYFIILGLEWMCTYIVYLLNADFKYWNLEISYNLLKWLNLNISTKVDTFFLHKFFDKLNLIIERIFICKLIPSVESTVKDWASLMCRPWKWRRRCYVSNTGMSLLHEAARVCLVVFIFHRQVTDQTSEFA